MVKIIKQNSKNQNSKIRNSTEKKKLHGKRLGSACAFEDDRRDIACLEWCMSKKIIIHQPLQSSNTQKSSKNFLQ